MSATCATCCEVSHLPTQVETAIVDLFLMEPQHATITIEPAGLLVSVERGRFMSGLLWRARNEELLPTLIQLPLILGV